MIRCDAKLSCNKLVAYVDHKGWCYCDEHGLEFKLFGRKMRKVKPSELKKS